MFKGFKKRRLAVALGVCMMAPSVAVHALGMGEIEVRSALNEPLKARIKLLTVTAAELSALKVTLASKEAFARMGIEPTPSLRDLRFEVITQGAGAPYIRIVSDAPIREPFLDLILMANWSNGQLLREYTLLLDPPVFDDGGAIAPVQAAKTESAAIDRGDKKIAAVSAVASAPRAAAAGSYGPTMRTDTLWSVARDMLPNKSVSVPQMMMALLKENPEAFVDGNVNNLKAGHILRAPSMAVISAVSGSQAVADTNRHYQEWQASADKSSTIDHRQQIASAPTSSTPAASSSVIESGARLKLLSPEEEAKQPSGTGSSTQGKAGVTGQLAIALETAEAAKQENSELKARLTDLERQLQAVQRLLTLKGDTLGALQAGLGESGLDVPNQQSTVDPAIGAGEQVAGIAEPNVIPMTDEAAANAKPLSTVAVQAEIAAEASLVDTIMADPILLGAATGGPLLLLLAVAIMRRRRQRAELEEIDGLASAVLPMANEHVPKATMVVAASKPVAEENFGEVIDEAVGSGFGEVSSIGAIQTEESEIDPIAEADVYLAYRRYEQAETLLKEAIRNDSDRGELKLKLLEIYFTTKDKDAFEAQAEALYASLAGQEDELWMQAVEMGREISPEHPLFAEVRGAPLVTGGVAVAAALSGAVAADEFGFEKPSPDVGDEFSFDLSDEDLATSLNMPSMEDSAMRANGDVLDVLEDEGPSISEAGLPFGDGLDDVSPVDEFSLDDNVAEIGDELLSFDELSPNGSGDELEPGEKDDSMISGNMKDHELNLDDETLDDFDSGLDDLTTGLNLDEPVGLQDGRDASAQSGVNSDGGSGEWSIEPAVSSFNSREVKSEMDDGYVAVTNVLKGAATASNVDHLTIDEIDFDLDSGSSENDVFESSDDIVGTKLDLARAYIDMGDRDGARSILDEVVKEGGDTHRQEAEQLMRQIS